MISPARTAAFDVLMRIETDRAYTSVLLPIAEEPLSPPDRSLCHELVMGTLRRQIYLDRAIDELSGGRKLDIAVRISLRLALYQIYYLERVPQYSAINESVELVQSAKKTSAKGFVNAILRRATREDMSYSYRDEIERISVETSHPRWLIEKWSADFGMDEAGRIAAANNKVPPLAFRVTGKLRVTSRKMVDSLRKSINVEGCYFADKNSEALFNLSKNGEIYFQDEGSQLVANAVSISQGSLILDVCAAPGGKTGVIAMRSLSRAATVIAGDVHWARVGFLRDNLRRQGVDFVNIVQHDAELPLPFERGVFDSVFVDVPCSGTGTIRRNPEIRYFLQPSDLAELPGKQLSILINASKQVKKGGYLLYSTCSLELQENEGVCNQFLTENIDFEIVKPDVPDKLVKSDKYARTWPHRGDMDGFFIAAFHRR